MGRTVLVDSTLREGAQAPGRYLTPARAAEVVLGLARVGVEELELGHAVAEPSYGPGPVARLLAAAREAAPGVRRSVWCRARARDVAVAAALRPDAVAFAVPVSDRHLRLRLRVDRAWVPSQVERLTRQARAAGVGYVSVGLEDATRADPGFLDEVATAAAAAGADRIRIADTVGIASPPEVAALVARMRACFPRDIGVHLHDDFGMATAGSIAAIEAGANAVDVSLLGLGERAGIARTEEVAAWLTVRGRAGYDLGAARRICHTLADWVSRPVPDHAAVIGPHVFACESGLHVAGDERDPGSYEPFSPELVGARRARRVGRHSGRAAVAGLLAGVVPLDPNGLTEATARLRREAARRGRALEPSECLEVLRTSSRIGRSLPTAPTGTA